MAHLPTALIERQASPERMARALDLMASLGMGHAFVAANGRDAPTSMAAAARAGAIGISGEFGGGGTLTPATLAATQRAIDNLLQKLGVTDTPVLGPHAPGAGDMQLLELDSHEQNIFATRRGWFEPAVDIRATCARAISPVTTTISTGWTRTRKSCVSACRVSSSPGDCIPTANRATASYRSRVRSPRLIS